MNDVIVDSVMLGSDDEQFSELRNDDDNPALHIEEIGKNKPETSVKRRSVKSLQPKLNVERLKGPRGLVILENWFKNIHYLGKRHEKEDLDTVMCLLEQWTHRLFPKFTFDDALSRIEKLGHKSQISTFVKRVRINDVDLAEENPNVNPVTKNDIDAVFMNTDQPLDEVMDRTHDQFTLSEAQRERMIRNRLLAEERKMARLHRVLEKSEN